MPGPKASWLAKWLNVIVGLVAAFLWAISALHAFYSDDHLPTRLFVAWFALVLTGTAFGMVLSVFPTPRREDRRTSDAPTGPGDNARTTNILLALMATGLGFLSIPEASAAALDWTVMVIASLAGGLSVGLALAPRVTNRAPRDDNRGQKARAAHAARSS